VRTGNSTTETNGSANVRYVPDVYFIALTVEDLKTFSGTYFIVTALMHYVERRIFHAVAVVQKGLNGRRQSDEPHVFSERRSRCFIQGTSNLRGRHVFRNIYVTFTSSSAFNVRPE